MRQRTHCCRADQLERSMKTVGCYDSERTDNGGIRAHGVIPHGRADLSSYTIRDRDSRLAFDRARGYALF